MDRLTGVGQESLLRQLSLMSFTIRCVTAWVLLATGAFLGQAVSDDATKPNGKKEELASALIRVKDAAVTTGDWGHWLRYFRGDTHGSQDLVVLAVTLKPRTGKPGMARRCHSI
jgi:hypothetical protein